MFDKFCSFFTSAPQPGQYVYEAFKKVPQLNVLIQAANMISGMKNGNIISNIGTIANVANMAGNAFGFNPTGLINNSKIGNIGGLGGIISQFISNVPEASVKANDSNL